MVAAHACMCVYKLSVLSWKLCARPKKNLENSRCVHHSRWLQGCAQQAVSCRRLQVQALLITVDDVDIRGCGKHVSGTRRARPRHCGRTVRGACMPLSPLPAGLAPEWKASTCRKRASSSGGSLHAPMLSAEVFWGCLGVMAAPMPLMCGGSTQ